VHHKSANYGRPGPMLLSKKEVKNKAMRVSQELNRKRTVKHNVAIQ